MRFDRVEKRLRNYVASRRVGRMGRFPVETVRGVLYAAVLLAIGVDFLGHATNLLHLNLRALRFGFRGVEYGTPMYELVATVYWGFVFVLLLFAIVFSEANFEV